jgi:hypothetical protein
LIDSAHTTLSGEEKKDATSIVTICKR